MTGLARRLGSLPGRMLLALSDALPQARLEGLIVGLVARRVRSLPPAEALKLLFRIDQALYPLQGRCAVDYGNGVHTKHRHTGYHDFFVRRCPSRSRVLELGCGGGALADDIASRTGCRVVAIDIVAANIEAARQRYSSPVDWRVGDATQGLPEGPFDIVVLSNVLEHIDDRGSFLAQIHILAPGRLLIRVPDLERDWRVPLKRELGVEWRLDPTHATEYTAESLRHELAAAKFAVRHLDRQWGEIWAEAGPT